MERIDYNSLKFIEFLDNLNPRNSGIFFSILLHFTILMFSIGLPNFFSQKEIFVPNIIPIEILNVSETTNIEKTKSNNNKKNTTVTKQKKFNSSNNIEVQKNFDINEKSQQIDQQSQPAIEIKEKSDVFIEEKKITKIEQKKIIQPEIKTETVKTKKIKPKLKPKLEPELKVENSNLSDLQIQPKIKKQSEPKKTTEVKKPNPKPKEDFSIATMLKDLRNEKSNNESLQEMDQNQKEQQGKDKKNENMILSISEIDLLRQQLSSCWNAPAGAVIERGMKVTISAKVQQNMQVYQNSVRIVDTNISKSNAFYGPITDSAMRTLLNPECTPLKLPKEKYNLWKNLTITFDYSIMKGY